MAVFYKTSKEMVNLPIGILLLPLMLITIVSLSYLSSYIGKYKIQSQKNFFAAYWAALVLIELAFILFLVKGVQFLPLSFYINYVYGTIFFVLYSIQCISSQNLLGEKLKFIGTSAALNYIIIPLSLSFL